MTRLAVILAIVSAAVLTATAGADAPPPRVANVSTTLLQPVAGHTFTGVTVVPLHQPGVVVSDVTCPARIRGTTLTARKQRFYTPGVGLVAVTCSWHVPASARGTLSTEVVVYGTDNNGGYKASWRIKH
jgi:hypothetical protein